MKLKIKALANGNDTFQFNFMCPGCKCWHGVSAPTHKFNADFEKPTFQPSVLFKAHEWVGTDGKKRSSPLCHSFVYNGMIQFLSDCTHPLKNTIVELPKIGRHLDNRPHWLVLWYRLKRRIWRR